MPQSQEAGLPPMILTDDYKIAFEARDATGAAVANVKIANPHILGERAGDIELVPDDVIPPYTDEDFAAPEVV